MNKLTTTLYTMAWNGYWERFGSEWSQSIENLNTKPDQIFVISDAPIPSCPYEVIINEEDTPPYKVAGFRNTAVKHAECDWIVPSDLDDLPYPLYLDNLNADYDIHNFRYMRGMNDTPNIEGDVSIEWKNMVKLGRPPRVTGTSAVKRKALIDNGIKHYPIGNIDWLVYVEMNLKGCSFYYEKDVLRFYRRLIPGSLGGDKRKAAETKKRFTELVRKYG